MTVDALADALGVSRGAVTAIQVTDGGTGYNPAAPPMVKVDAPPDGGTQATAAAVVSEAGALTAVNVVLMGAGYAAPPTVAVLWMGVPAAAPRTATAAATIDDNEAGRLLAIAGALVDAYLRDPDDTLECPETIRDEALIRTAGHVRGRHNYGQIEGRLKAGGAHIGVLQPAARSAVRQSGAGALLAPWVRRTA